MDLLRTIKELLSIYRKAISRVGFIRASYEFAFFLIARSFKDSVFINSATYWEERYHNSGTSGAGSYGILAEYKADFINKFCISHNINKVIELGCGDGNQLSLCSYREYIGLDVSCTAIELCKQKFTGDESKSFFAMNGALSPEEIDAMRSDLALSLDVIFHLVEDRVFEDYMIFAFQTLRKIRYHLFR